MRQAVLN
jgi:hypothetical protein